MVIHFQIQLGEKILLVAQVTLVVQVAQVTLVVQVAQVTLAVQVAQVTLAVQVAQVTLAVQQALEVIRSVYQEVSAVLLLVDQEELFQDNLWVLSHLGLLHLHQ